MGQTANFHLRYADLADPADAQVATQNLATDVDAALGQVSALPKNIPGQIVLWPGGALPDVAKYGRWAWCDGAPYPTATYPDAAAHVAGVWRTFGGAADPGAGNFRVPDLRGLVTAGADPMVQGATKTTRLVRVASHGTLTGSEYVTLSVAQMPYHNHGVSDPTHGHSMTGPNVQLLEWFGSGTVAGGGAGGWTTSQQHVHTIYGNYTGISIAAEGGGGAHENMPPTVFVPYIIFLG